MDPQKRRSASMTPQPLPQITEEDSPESIRDTIDALLGVDATRESRNAFAEGDLRLHRHRLAGNAFYQEKFAARKHTPPTMTHPALRHNVDIYNISVPLPELEQDKDDVDRSSPEMKQLRELKARDSSATTMSTFVNAGRDERTFSPSPTTRAGRGEQPAPPSPELKLAPSPNLNQVPTMRDGIEQRAAADQLHGGRTNSDEHITVSRPSPKVTRFDFAYQPPRYGNEARRTSSSPKKSFLDRFRAPSSRHDATPEPLPDVRSTAGYSNMPPKARAVLISTPPGAPRSPRSPLKKSFWQRSKTPAIESNVHDAPVEALKAPPRAAISLTHRTPRSQFLPTIARSQSLKHPVSPIPPTPPAKDTPPEERSSKDAVPATDYSIANSTPSRTAGFKSLNATRQEWVMPNNTGTYSRRGVPTVVTQSSMQSLRAPIGLSQLGVEEYHDLDDSMNGLGLDLQARTSAGQPRQSNAVAPYSPSMYSPDTTRHSMDTFPSVSTHVHQRSASASAVVCSVAYPDLARDPSVMSFVTPNKEKVPVVEDSSYAKFMQSKTPPGRDFQREFTHEDIEDGFYGTDDLLQASSTSPYSHDHLFAQQTYSSSPALSHASAQVSPLHLQPAKFVTSSRNNVFGMTNRQADDAFVARQGDFQITNSNGELVYLPDEGVQLLTNGNGERILPNRVYSPRVDSLPWKTQPWTTSVPGEKLKNAVNSTAITPGLQYDSGVDVDPEKPSVKHSPAVKHTCSPSARTSDMREKETKRWSIPESTLSAVVTTINMLDGDVGSTEEMLGSCKHANTELDNVDERLNKLEEHKRRKVLQHDMLRNDRANTRHGAVPQRKESGDRLPHRLSGVDKSKRQDAVCDIQAGDLKSNNFSGATTPENRRSNENRRTSRSPSHAAFGRKTPAPPHPKPSSRASPGPREGRRVSTEHALAFYQSPTQHSPVANHGNTFTSGSDSSTPYPPFTPDDILPPQSLQNDSTDFVSSDTEQMRQLRLEMALQQQKMEIMLARMAEYERNIGSGSNMF